MKTQAQAFFKAIESDQKEDTLSTVNKVEQLHIAHFEISYKKSTYIYSTILLLMMELFKTLSP